MSANVRTIAKVVWLQWLRRKDVYILLILLGAMLFAMTSLNAFGLGGSARYVRDVGLLLAWLFAWILAVMLPSRELPQEEIRGTVYALLARPVTRAEVVAGKWLGTWSVAAGSATLFHLAVAGVTWGLGARPDHPLWVQGLLLHAGVLAIVSAFAVLCSTRLNADAAATLTWLMSAACFLVAPRVPELLVHQGGPAGAILLALYHLAPHFDILDLRMRIVHDYGPIPWSLAGALLLYAAAWTALFLLGAWLAYRRKRFSRERLAA